MKKYFPFLFIILFLLIFSYLFGGEYKDFYLENKQVYNSQQQLKEALENFNLNDIQEIENIELFETPNTELLETLVSKIKQAKKRVFIEVYILTEKRIQEALAEAQKNGVEVKVILEKNPYQAPGLNNKTYENLKNKNIEITWSEAKNYPLNHSKLIIIDNETIISTGNLSYSTFTKNKDFFLSIKDEKITNSLSALFNNDFENKKNIIYHDNLVLSPQYSRKKLEYMIQSAQNKISLYFPYLQDKNLETFVKNSPAKVKQIIIDKKSAENNAQTIENLQSSGVEIYILPKYTLHAKAILIDQQYLYIGSINFSLYSLDYNREIGIIIKEKNIIEAFQKTFLKDLKNKIPKKT